MMTACLEGNEEIVKELLALNVNLNLTDNKRRNCLFYILENKKKEPLAMMMKLILDKNK